MSREKNVCTKFVVFSRLINSHTTGHVHPCHFIRGIDNSKTVYCKDETGTLSIMDSISTLEQR